MKLLLDTLMIFFGILAAAGLVALGETAEAEPLGPATLPSLTALTPAR